MSRVRVLLVDDLAEDLDREVVVEDVRHALIGPGVFASHGYERTHVKGIHNTCDLIYAYVMR